MANFALEILCCLGEHTRGLFLIHKFAQVIAWGGAMKALREKGA